MKLKRLLKYTSVLSIGTIATFPIVTSCSKTEDIYDDLKNLAYVTKVDRLETPTGFKAKYMVWFKAPLDWNDISKGSFPIKAEVWLRGKNKINQFAIDGYALSDKAANRINDWEIANRYQGNIIRPECRFFGDSRPTDLDNTKLALWEDFNDEQITEDFNLMISSLKTILTKKWVVTGTSRGGMATNYIAMKHPEVADVYVPYVALDFFKREDAVDDESSNPFYERVYGYIGNNALGEETAEEYRKQIAQFQYFCMVNREEPVSKDETTQTMFKTYWDSVDPSVQFSTFGASEYGKQAIYDTAINEYATSFWQYDQNIKQLTAFNAMSEEGDAIYTKRAKAAQILIDECAADEWSMNKSSWPYEVASAIDQGEHGLLTKYMESNIVKYCGKTAAEVKSHLTNYMQIETNQKGLLWKLVFTQDQIDTWTWDCYGNNEMAKVHEWFTSTNQAKVIMINGAEDTWMKYGFKPTEKQSGDLIKMYISSELYKNNQGINPAWGCTHRCRINFMPSSMQTQIWSELDSILK